MRAIAFAILAYYMPWLSDRKGFRAVIWVDAGWAIVCLAGAILCIIFNE
jgi:hypothetical protein